MRAGFTGHEHIWKLRGTRLGFALHPQLDFAAPGDMKITAEIKTAVKDKVKALAETLTAKNGLRVKAELLAAVG